MNQEERWELVTYKITRAKETLKEVELHVQNNLWITAVNRLYYACFYAVSALLIHNEIEAQTHSGTKQMLGLHFIKTGVVASEHGRFYTSLFNLRQTGDYDAFVEFDQEIVMPLLQAATQLVNDIAGIITKPEFE